MLAYILLLSMFPFDLAQSFSTDCGAPSRNLIFFHVSFNFFLYSYYLPLSSKFAKMNQKWSKWAYLLELWERRKEKGDWRQKWDSVSNHQLMNIFLRLKVHNSVKVPIIIDFSWQATKYLAYRSNESFKFVMDSSLRKVN